MSLSISRAGACALVVVGLMLGGAIDNQAEAQFGGLGRKIKAKAKARVEQKEDQAAEKVVDAADPSGKTDGGEAADDNAVADGGSETGGSKAAAGGSAASAKPGSGVWANYDFVPGAEPLFVEDLSKGAVGDFPKRLTFVEGNMETVEWREGRWLRATSWPSKFAITLDQQLPERFTLEFDVTPGRANNHMKVSFADSRNHTVVHLREISSTIEGGVEGGGGPRALSRAPMETNEPFRARIMADGKHVKVYVNETRVANVPTANLGRTEQILFEFPGLPDDPAFIANISLMSGGRELYDALESDGRVATQGIYFDTGSDRIRPESTPTLKQIAAMLKEHADLKLTIEGHTDNVGKPEANRALSQKRAAAVKAYLMESHGVEGERLEAAGLGDTKPAAPNTSAEGRQQNRRVELVKLP